jgi:hypothetical protein
VTSILRDILDRHIVYYRSPDAKLIGSTAASRRLVVAQHLCQFPLYVTTSITSIMPRVSFQNGRY